ncbi:helix-turn-helix domain-containing protein [Streptomyces sp. NPDC018584]|uniref:helix-turn-helix domain-containing protein n=1 Tax=unclassified Streptomyces TaxID=2593676 RepID=UPI0037BA8F6E
MVTDNRALRDLAEWLRAQRYRTGLGYRALAERAGCHATTLQRAVSGESVPKLQTVLSYARACDASPEEARRLWREARYEHTRRRRGGSRLPAPKPLYVRDFADLNAALLDLYEKAGSPALRTMEERAGRYGVLPRTTVHRIVHRQTMPRGLPQFRAYLKACEVSESDWQEWEAAWTRAWRHERNTLDGTAEGALGTGNFLAEAHRILLTTSVRRGYSLTSNLALPPQRAAVEGRPASRRQPEQQVKGQLSLPIGGGPAPGSEVHTLSYLPPAPVRPKRSKAA